MLVLGSLPGERSLMAARYYAHPQNQFWRLLGAALGFDLAGLPYDERLSALLSRGVGLWDVVGSADRVGSLDSSIKDMVPNDLDRLVHGLPQLSTIAFNGATAAAVGRRALADEGAYRLIDLPSSSPAYTRSFASKLEAWSALGRLSAGVSG